MRGESIQQQIKRFTTLAAADLLVISICTACWLIPGSNANAQAGIATEEAPTAYMYRYRSSQGNPTLGFQVPTEAIQFGYEVLDRHLRVIKRVDPPPPPPTEAENSAKRNERDTRLAQERLLRAFSGSADAQRAMDRKIAALDVIIKLTESNIRRLNLDYETLASDAATHQRKGMLVPDAIKENMRSVERQIADANLFIESKYTEQEAIRARYSKDIEILKEMEARKAKQ